MGRYNDVYITSKSKKVVSEEATFFVLALDKKICYIPVKQKLFIQKKYIQLWKK